MKKNKVVVGVSGGPDSIYLLDCLHKNSRYIPIVVHVNYFLRETSTEEENFVKNFCKEKNIKIFIKRVNKNDWDFFSYLSNKQSIAREIRYKEYINVAKKEKANFIFLAHHKDDFLETAIMQEKRSDDYIFYGIKEFSIYKGYTIVRPLISKFKSEILNELNINKINYKIDESNFLPIYERNKIRINLSKKTIVEKENLFLKFSKINIKNKELDIEVENEYSLFKESKFDWSLFQKIKNKKQVIYKWFIDQDERINISSEKIKGVIDFLKIENKNKSYRLMKNIFMTVKNSKIIIYYTNN